MNDTRQKVARALVAAASTFREDQKEAYMRAIAGETNDKARWVLEQILENARVAEQARKPLCDDTGIPHLLLEVGPSRSVSAQLLADIRAGVAEGLRLLPGRPMAVRGNAMARIDQSGGLSDDPADVLPAPIAVRETDNDVLRLTVLMLGGGPAIRGVTRRVFHRHSTGAVVDEIVARATEGIRSLGCSPCTLALGIGRSQYEATSLMLEAMAKGDYGMQSDFEQEITARVNAAAIGPLGLGGGVSVLATFARIGPQRASGVRIVALRPCCCFEPRRASVDL